MTDNQVKEQANRIEECCDEIKSATTSAVIKQNVQEIRRCCDELESMM